MEARNAWGKIVGSVCSRLWVDNLFVWLCWYLIVGWQFAYLVVFAFGCGLTICLYLVLSWQFVCVVVFVFGCIWLWDDNLFVFGCELIICLCGCVCICLYLVVGWQFVCIWLCDGCAMVAGWLAAFAVVHRVPTVTSIHPKTHPHPWGRAFWEVHLISYLADEFFDGVCASNSIWMVHLFDSRYFWNTPKWTFFRRIFNSDISFVQQFLQLDPCTKTHKTFQRVVPPSST